MLKRRCIKSMVFFTVLKSVTWVSENLQSQKYISITSHIHDTKFGCLRLTYYIPHSNQLSIVDWRD